MKSRDFFLITLAVFLGTLATAGIIGWIANNKLQDLKNSNSFLGNILG